MTVEFLSVTVTGILSCSASSLANASSLSLCLSSSSVRASSSAYNFLCNCNLKEINGVKLPALFLSEQAIQLMLALLAFAFLLLLCKFFLARLHTPS